MKANQTKTALSFLVLIFLFPSFLLSAPLRNVPKTIKLPDNSIVNCFASGDEFYNWLHDKNGYTLHFGDDGFLYYAIKDGDNLKPSQYRYQSVNPETVNIQPGNLISLEAYLHRREKYFSFEDHSKSVTGPHFGIINNLVVFIRFSDDTEFNDLLSYYDNLFNSSSLNANSMKHFFSEVSYDQLAINTSFYPVPTGLTIVSYQDDNPRGYYDPYNATTNTQGYSLPEQRTEREQTLVANAINAVSSQIPADLDIDNDNDGYVDNVCLIIKGSFTEGGLLWPHKISLFMYEVYINNIMIKNYNLQIEEFLKIYENAVLCHEMAHAFEFPDLYHYDSIYFDLHPIGQWDCLDNNPNPPVHMGSYLKWKYGWWIQSMPVCVTSGYYQLNPLNSGSSLNVCLRINSPNSPQGNEYYIVEYRRKTGTFESSLPGEGMIIYRINSDFEGNAFFDGVSVFDEVYAYRPDGTTTLNGEPDEANYSQLVGRTSINCSTNPTPFLTNGGSGDLDIREITDHNGTLTFLLIYNEPENLTLNQSNTEGLYAASNGIKLQNGFSTTPSNSFRAIVSGCNVKDNLSYPHFEFIEVITFNQVNQKINSFFIQNEIGSVFDINTIRNKPDNNNYYLTPGTYEYIAKRAGVKIENGSILVE